MPIQILRTNREAQLCKKYLLVKLSFCVTKKMFKTGLPAIDGCNSKLHTFGQFCRRSDSPMQHDASTMYLSLFSTTQVSIHHSLLLNTER